MIVLLSSNLLEAVKRGVNFVSSMQNLTLTEQVAAASLNSKPYQIILVSVQQERNILLQVVIIKLDNAHNVIAHHILQREAFKHNAYLVVLIKLLNKEILIVNVIHNF